MVEVIKPDPENILAGVNALVEKWKPIIKDKIPDCKRVEANRICVYKRIWEKNMELIYGKNVLDSVGGKKVELFAELTIYVTLLKILGSTILESIHGGGRYTIPLRLAGEGSNATLEMFWERKALSSFNINYIFERDEYDWIFSPDTARELDGFFQDIGKLLLKFDWSASIGLDLLKRVYMNIVDRDLRRQLGEFYTPDWLAKMMLWRALHLLVKGSPPKDILISNIDDGIVDLINEFYEKNGRIPRVVDPTCGSFTFGVQYLSSLLEWYASKRPSVNPVEMASQILENVVGFDVNPVAVITARVNYLLQINRLLAPAGSYLYEEPMMPVYRLDLTMIHDVKKSTRTLGKGDSVGLEGFMQTIEWIEAIDIDTIKASLLKGYTMALAVSNRGFDIVIGNLPWVNISRLPSNYRKKLSNLAKELGVNPTRQATKKLDISVVLFAVSTKYLVRSGGVVALMVPTSIFRGLHGSGWRFFVDRELSLYEVFDLEEIKPFEQAVNQPGIVLAAKKGWRGCIAFPI